MKAASVKPTADNVLVQLLVDAEAHDEERRTAGGIYLPRSRDVKTEDAIFARVVAVGPGYFPDRWIDHEQGMAPLGTRHGRIPVDAAIRPGATVVLNRAALGADRVRDEAVSEFRMIKAHCVEAVVE